MDNKNVITRNKLKVHSKVRHGIVWQKQPNVRYRLVLDIVGV